MKKELVYILIVLLLCSYAFSSCNSESINKDVSFENLVSTDIPVLIPPFPYEGTPLSSQLNSVEDEMIDGMNKVKIIVQSIEKYYLDNGIYPDNLNILTTNYLESIPTTITGENFYYQLSKSNIYTVYFKVQRNSTENREVYCGFIRRLLIWECSGKSH
jgi:hypothetical protein